MVLSRVRQSAYFSYNQGHQVLLSVVPRIKYLDDANLGYKAPQKVFSPYKLLNSFPFAHHPTTLTALPSIQLPVNKITDLYFKTP